MSDEPMQETEQSKTEPPESGAGYDDPDEVRAPSEMRMCPAGVGATLSQSPRGSRASLRPAGSERVRGSPEDDSRACASMHRRGSDVKLSLIHISEPTRPY